MNWREFVRCKANSNDYCNAFNSIKVFGLNAFDLIRFFFEIHWFNSKVSIRTKCIDNSCAVRSEMRFSFQQNEWNLLNRYKVWNIVLIYHEMVRRTGQFTLTLFLLLHHSTENWIKMERFYHNLFIYIHQTTAVRAIPSKFQSHICIFIGNAVAFISFKGIALPNTFSGFPSRL